MIMASVSDSPTAYLQSLTRFGIQPGLERIRALVEAAGHPEALFPTIVVGGTNGKGSVAEILTSIFAASGRRVGLFTSPHIHDYRERFRINRSLISDADLARLLIRVEPWVAAAAGDPDVGQPTEFEVSTIVAFLYFAERKVDLAVLEVGLGGRYDSTNVTNPLVSVITNVSLDHCDRLGDTVEAIAADKVGIVPYGGTLVTGETSLSVCEIFYRHAAEQQAELKLAGRDFHHRVRRLDADGCTVDVVVGDAEYLGLRSTLIGEFQPANIAVAVAAAHEAGEVGLPLEADDIARGVALARVEGRMEIISHRPLVILDGANNPAGAASLTASLRQVCPQRRFTTVIGISADKDQEPMLEALASVTERFIVTAADNPRAEDAERIAEKVRRLTPAVEVVCPSSAAVARAVELAGRTGAILITGSFFLLGEVDRERFR